MLIDWFTVIAQIANFIVLVWLMKRYLYQPILSAIDAREARIAAELKDAQTKQAAAAQERDDFRQKNEAFEQCRDALLKAAQNDAKTERQKLFEEARQDAAALRAKLDAAMQSERSTLNRALAERVRQEVFAVARKVLADLATVSVEAQMGRVFAERLRTLDEPAKAVLDKAIKTATEPALVRSAFELPVQQREAIQQALNETFSAQVPARFDAAPSLVCGIELSVHGQKLAWSIDAYLSSLDRRMNELLAPNDQLEGRADPVEAAPAKFDHEPAHEPNAAGGRAT